MSPRTSLLAAVFAWLCSGCAATRPLAANPGDYWAYRATRVAKTVDERLAAAVRYLARYPEGTFAPDVSAFFARTEPVFYASRKDSAAGLSAYLRALPRGPHAPAALEQLRTLLAKRAAPDAMGRAAIAAGARVDREIARRVAVREQISLWIGRFLDVEVWRRPLSGAPGDLIVAWALGLPAPSCLPLAPALHTGAPGASGERLRCVKRIEVPYTVVLDGRPEPRQAAFEIALVQDTTGHLHEMALAGPDLFVRIEETYAVRPIAPDDTASRISAIARTIELVRREFGQRVSGQASCNRKVVAPVVLDLACGGLRLKLSAGLDASEDDRVVLTRFDG